MRRPWNEGNVQEESETPNKKLWVGQWLHNPITRARIVQEKKD